MSVGSGNRPVKIKRLRLTGFKSFVEPAELRIEPGLTGVVGPNGCGKSNLLEAIRWVMGESSPKSMRSGGMDDVIFAGTSSRPARDFAEVALVADLEGAALTSIGDGDSDGELEVIRRIERGQGSAYRANGRDVRAKDISLIFADAATGAHSPALVSQGKIAAVISAKPAERRQMLEEAAGIAGLHVRRKDAEQKLRATEANLERLDTIIGDMAQRAGQLRRQARAAERYTRLSEQIRIAEARMIYARWRDAAAAADTAREEAEAASLAVRAAQEAQEAASAYRVQAAQTLDSRRTASREANDAASAVAQRLARLTAEAEAHDRRAADLAEQLQRIADDRAREGSLAEDAAESIARLDREGEELGEQHAAAEARLPELTQAIATSAATLRDAEVELAQLRADLAGQAADRRIAEASAASARDALARIESERDAVAARIAALGDEAALIDAQQDASARVMAAAAAAETSETALTDAQAALDAALASKAESEQALAAARTALATIESEHGALATALATPGDTTRAIDRVTAAKGYEHALAAALGDDLDAPVGGESGWLGAAMSASDPNLPAGTERLADHVDAPPELARRLAQVAVAQTRRGASARDRAAAGHPRRRDAPLGRFRCQKRRRGRCRTACPAQPVERHRARTAGVEGRARHRNRASHRYRRGGRCRPTGARRSARRALAQRRGTTHRPARRRPRAGRARSLARRRRSARRPPRRTRHAPRRRARHAHRSRGGTRRPPRCRCIVRAPRRQRSADRCGAPRSERRARSRTGAAGQTRRAARASRRHRGRSRSVARALGRSGNPNRQAGRTPGEPRSRNRPRRTTPPPRCATISPGSRRAATSSPHGATRCRPRKRPRRLRSPSARTGSPPRAKRYRARAKPAPAPMRAPRRRICAASKWAACRTSASNVRRRCSRASPNSMPTTSPTPARNRACTRSSPPIANGSGRSISSPRRNSTSSTPNTRQSLTEAEELRQAVARLRGSIGSLNREGRIRLKAAFEAVDTHFQRLFTTLFNGGAAHLELVDSDDPLEAGLEIMAQPPGKKLASLTLLSGGEQALTAIALIFGLFLTNPAPICVLDEVDAPLDDANIERFCDLLDKMVAETRTRYLIVTHNAVTMSRMHRLFGVTMVEQGVSRLVSVDLEAAEELVAA